METFSALLALCAGNSSLTGEFPSQRPVTRSFNVFFDLRLSKRLSKQSWGWWFETPLCSSWRHCNDVDMSVERLNPTTKTTHFVVHSKMRNNSWLNNLSTRPNEKSCFSKLKSLLQSFDKNENDKFLFFCVTKTNKSSPALVNLYGNLSKLEVINYHRSTSWCMHPTHCR